MANKRNVLFVEMAVLVIITTITGANLVHAAKSDINAQLIAASGSGQVETVKLLLDRGADVNANDGQGWTALISASCLGRTDMVKLLLDRGADVNAKDKKGTTALRLATIASFADIVELLKSHGARE